VLQYLQHASCIVEEIHNSKNGMKVYDLNISIDKGAALSTKNLNSFLSAILYNLGPENKGGTMPTRLIVSAPATGKSKACIEEIRFILNKQPLSQIRVIVPDRLQAAYFRRRLSVSGGTIGVYVGTFNDLYKNILEKAGRYIPVASIALLHRIVQDVVDATPLIHYAPLRTMPGFILALQDAFAELKRALVYPETFIDSSKNTPLARQELAQLYATYQTKLRSMGWADFEGLSWLAVAALEEIPNLMDNSMQLLVVDGFDSFIGTQRRILQLLEKSTDLLITLPGNTISFRTAHRRFTRTYSAVQNDLSPELLINSSTPFLPPDIAHVERNLFESTPSSIIRPTQSFLRELRSPAEEARESLRWIKSLVLREGILLQECAIFASNLDQYRPYLHSVAREFGVPVHFTQSNSLTASSVITALLHLLNLPVQNFRTNALFKVLRSPYFSFDLPLETIDALEQISRLGRVVEGREQWNEIWERLLIIGTKSASDLDDERALKELPHGETARYLRKKLEDFFQTITPPDGVRTQTEWTRWLEDLLDKLRFHENSKGEQDEIALEGFREALRALVMSESIAGDRVVGHQQYISDLQNTLARSMPSEPAPLGTTLLIGNIREARGLRFQAVAILGLSEGIFPSIERPDPFLPETLREELGLDSRLEREQGSLFYQAVTRADTHLLLTRPYLSDDGEPWEPSPYWNAVVSMFEKDTTVQMVRPDAPRPLADAASSQELLFWAVRRKSLPQAYEDLEVRWHQLQLARNVIQSRRAKRADGVYEGRVADLQAELAKRFAPDKTWSTSRLETYGTCPQMFYVRTVLDLEAIAPPSLGLDVAQIGSILHKVLEEVFRTADDPANADFILKRLPEIASSVFARAPQDFGFRPSELWELEQEQFLNQLENTISALAKASEGWTPMAYEQTFGIQDAPPLEITLEDSKALLRGVIDRVDRDADGNLRVVDYKTGSSHLNKEDLIHGRRLQLPLYALAAKEALRLGEPVEGLYWKIRDAEEGSLKLSSFKSEAGVGIEAAIQTAKEHLARILKGIRTGDFPPTPPKGGCPEYCPAVQWCWRYQKGGW
jgi:ATP-dependent helicase/DNAse subunit B